MVCENHFIARYSAPSMNFHTILNTNSSAPICLSYSQIYLDMQSTLPFKTQLSRSSRASNTLAETVILLAKQFALKS